MACPSRTARHWLLAQSDEPGCVCRGISALFHGSGAPATVSPLQSPREYITARAGQQAGLGVIIAISSLVHIVHCGAR